MMAWADGKQGSDAPSMEVHEPQSPNPDDDDEEEVEEALDVLGGREISIETFEDDDDDESSYRVSSIDEACPSKTESSCPSSADSLGLDPLGLRRSLSPRHHPLLSPMHMAKGGTSFPPRQVSPARSDAGVSSRAGCKRSVSSSVNGKELLSLPPSHSLPVSPLLHRKFFSARSPQRSLSHSRMAAGRSLTRLAESIVPPCEEEDEQRRRMRDILQNLPLAEIYKKRARRNTSRERASCEVLVQTPSSCQETPPLSAASSGRHNFKKALRDRYLLSQSRGGSGGGSSSSQDSAALDLTSERFTKIREPLKSETEELVSPHLMLTDDTNPNSPLDPILCPPGASHAPIPAILHHPPPRPLPTPGDDDAFYPATPGAGGQTAVTAAMAVQLIARTCRIESSSSSFLSADMDSDPFSPLSPMSPCLVSPATTSQQHLLTPPVTQPHHLQTGSGGWIQPASVPAIGVPRAGAPFLPTSTTGPQPGMHPGAIPIQRQCQSAPQTPHSSPQVRSHFFFPPHSGQMPPPAATGLLQPEPGKSSVSSALSSPGLSPGGEGGARVSHACPVCARSFSRSDMLSRHMRLHTGLKPYECASCGQSFSRSDHLNTHIRTHTGEKPYHCPQCSYSACRRDMITRHMKVHRRKLATGPAAGTTPASAGGISHSTATEGPTNVERGGESGLG